MLLHKALVVLTASTTPRKRVFVVCLIAVTLIAVVSSVAVAGNTATQVVHIRVEEIAVMDVIGALSEPLIFTVPENSEAAPVEHANTYLRYTSLVPEGKTRMITVAITAGSIPSGCALTLEAINLSCNGSCGNLVPGGVYLSRTPQSIITGIGGCYTGTASTDGALISHALVVKDAASLVSSETSTITISFTLTDAS